MRDKSIGRTSIDIVTSFGILAVLVSIIVAVVNPIEALGRRKDEMRVDGVRNIMEAMLELQTVAPEHMDQLRNAVEATGAPPRVMIGTAATCAGDWGSQCGDAILADGCVDLVAFLGDYLPQAPIDPSSVYSSEASGFYVTFTSGSLEVGACNPELQSEIKLERTFF